MAQTPVIASVAVASDCTALLNYTVTIPDVGQVKGANRWIIMDNGVVLDGGNEIWKRHHSPPGIDGPAAILGTYKRTSHLPIQ